MTVIHIRRQAAALQLLKFLHLLLLAADIALVLHGDLHLLPDGGRQVRVRRVKGAQVLVAYLGPAQQVDEAAAVGHRGGAPGRQQIVQGCRAGDAGFLQAPDLPLHGGVFLLHLPQPLPGYQADAVSHGAQAAVGVVLPQQQPVFRPAGHHAIRLLGALGHQVVDEGADVAFAALQDQRLPAQQFQRRVDPGHKALDRRLLVPGRTVELPGTV